MNNCVVCLEELNINKLNVKTLACGHKFHISCINSWINKCNFSCPLCRKQFIPSKSDLDCLEKRLVHEENKFKENCIKLNNFKDRNKAILSNLILHTKTVRENIENIDKLKKCLETYG